MLVDSGSTFSVLPSSAAEELGLELSSEPEERDVVGGSVPARTSRVHLQLLGKDRLGRSAPSMLLEPVLVTEKGRDTPIGLLGRHPFFDRYEVTFREMKQEIVLRDL